MSKLPSFKDEAQYKVKLAARASYGDTVFKPENSYTVKGKVAKAIKEAISEAEEV